MAESRMLVAAIMVVLLLAGCNAPDEAAVKQEVQVQLKQFAEAAQKDLSAMLAMYEPGPSTVSIGNGQIERGIESIRKRVDTNLVAALGRFKYDLGSIDVTPLGTGYALAVTPFVVTEQPPTTFSRPIRGVSTSIWKKGPSGWKVIHEHESFTP